MRVATLALCAALLGGCAAVPPAPTGPVLSWEQRLQALGTLQDWQLQGRVLVRNEEEGWNGTLHWQQRADAFEIRFTGPLGHGGVQLRGDRHAATLTGSDGQTATAPDARGLLLAQLGWQVPVDELRHWVLGRPAPSAAVGQMTLDQTNRLARLEQSGWRIDYRDYAAVDGLDLPRKIFIEEPRLSLRLVIDQWQLAQH